MKELRDFEKFLVEAKEEEFDVGSITQGEQIPANLGAFEYVNADDIYDSLVGEISSSMIAFGETEKSSNNKVEKVIKELIKDKVLDEFPKDMPSDKKLMWVNRAKPIVRAHMVLVGDLIL